MVNYLDASNFEKESQFYKGVGTLRSDLIYRSVQSAAHWISLTQEPDYPYFRVEKNQLTQLLASRSLDDRRRFSKAVCLGAAGSEKEIILARHVSQSGSPSEVTIVDSSPALLNHALEKFAGLAGFNVRGVLLDVRHTNSLQRAMGDTGSSSSEPSLFTAFGNIVGNYSELTLVKSLHDAMIENDRLVFGAHLKSCEIGSPLYPSYSTEAYFAHMRSALEDAGIDIKSGTFTTEESVSLDGLVDIIEVFFDLNRPTVVGTVPRSLSDGPDQEICRIRVDVSCKYSLNFLETELEKLAWRGMQYWISDCERNVIFSCDR